MTFTGFCDDAGHFSLDDRSAFRDAVAKAFKGQEVTVTVAKKTRQRSVTQNAWLWGVALPLIAEHCGYDHHEHDDLHYWLLAARFETKRVAPLPGGIEIKVPARTSSQLTTQEFSDYMEWLVRFAAQKFGVVIPLPGEAEAA